VLLWQFLDTPGLAALAKGSWRSSASSESELRRNMELVRDMALGEGLRGVSTPLGRVPGVA